MNMEVDFMKKMTIALALLIGVSAASCMPCSLKNVSAVLGYQSGYISNGELLISASDVIEIINEERAYLSFANVTGMGEILSLKERPESDEKIAELIKAEKRNIHYCYIESENCILYYNYNKNEIEKTDYDTSIKYTFDIVNENVVSKVTGEEICKISDNWWYTIYYNEYISTIYYIGNGTFISPESKTILPETGDIDNNGTIDLTDLTDLSLAIIGDKTLTAVQLKTSDIDSDGNVTVADLARLKQYVSKKITSLG